MYPWGLKEWNFHLLIKEIQSTQVFNPQRNNSPAIIRRKWCVFFYLGMEEGKQEEKQPVCNTPVMEIGWKTRKSNHIAIPSAW